MNETRKQIIELIEPWEELSDCCWATRVWETLLCSECKEYWFSN